AMLHLGMDAEAWRTAWGAVKQTYEVRGYWFMTPEAWTADGGHRSLAYMRPLAIWAMKWAWDRREEPPLMPDAPCGRWERGAAAFRRGGFLGELRAPVASFPGQQARD